MDVMGYIKPQLISRSRPDITPFSYFESSKKAEQDIDNFLLQSIDFDFLHIRGVVAGSSSPFNRFVKLLADNKFERSINCVKIGLLDPDFYWLNEYYSKIRGLSKEVTSTRIEECKSAISIAKTKLTRFSTEGKIKSWKIFLYKQVPIWRLLITSNGVIATPYGSHNRTVNNIVLLAESTSDPIYDSFKRYYNNLENESLEFNSSGLNVNPMVK